ncbi:hypothetical protein [Streptomyces sp. NPDC088400]
MGATAPSSRATCGSRTPPMTVSGKVRTVELREAAARELAAG